MADWYFFLDTNLIYRYCLNCFTCIGVCMLSVCMLKNKPSKCLVILFYNFQQVQYIFVTLYIVLWAKIFENFLEFKLVELHNNLDKVCICQLM